MVKSSGPRMEPWETPEDTSWGEEVRPFKTTHCSLPER